jgi:membrane protease YdiL (CAAX protease family)
LNQATEDLPSNEPTPPPPPSTLQRVLFGPDGGLRAGWGLLLFIALFAALLFAVNVIAHHLHPHVPKPAAAASDKSVPLPSMLIGELIPFSATLLITWIMSKIEGRPNSVYGLGGSRKLSRFLYGLAWGAVCLSILVFSLWKTGLLIIDSRLLFSGDALRYGAAWLVGFLLVALFEEYLTRGYLQFTLARGLTGFYQWAFKARHSAALGFWSAALILSTLFGLSHGSNPGESPIGLFCAGLAAMVFCLSLWRTGSLWWAIGFHATWDWAQSFIYGVADSGTMVQHHLLATHPVGKPLLSGGSTGPEGSLFVIPVMILICVIIVFTLPHAQHNSELQAYPREA